MPTPYFANFPTMLFKGEEVVDITKQIQFVNKITNRAALFDRYIIQEGDTPDTVAFDFYGSSYYEWVVLFFNNIVDPFYDWVLHDEEIEKYIQKKYGNDRIKTHHFYDEKTGYIIREEDFSQGSRAIAVSNQQHEINENEKKREILILKEPFIPQVEEELKERLS